MRQAQDSRKNMEPLMPVLAWITALLPLGTVFPRNTARQMPEVDCRKNTELLTLDLDFLKNMGLLVLVELTHML